MTYVLLVAHHERVEAAVLARQAARWLAERGHEGWMTPEDAKVMELDDLASERVPAEAGLALSLGTQVVWQNQGVRLGEGSSIGLCSVYRRDLDRSRSTNA
jgi:hypothetical protein